MNAALAARSPAASLSGAAPSRAPRRRLAGEVVAVVTVCLMLGGLTSPAQGWLPDALRPFANSASGWTVLTALAVGACRARPLPSALLGVLGFVALLVGYQAVSALRGIPDSEQLFLAAAIVVGPVVGLAASWIRRRDRLAAIGTGVLAGIGLGDGLAGLLLVSATTGPVYWILIGLAAIALAAGMVARRLPRPRDRAVAVVATVAVAGAMVLAYSALG